MRFVPEFFLALSLCCALSAKDRPVSPTNEANRTTESSRERMIRGRLIDAGCQKQTASECPVNSATERFGIILPDGKFAKFDEGGQAKVRTALESSKHGRKLLKADRGKGKSPEVTVEGTLTADTFNLENLRLK